MNVRPRVLCVATVLCAVGVAASASAQVPVPYGYGNYWFGPPYNFSQREHIPYFSLHPPVYYSQPVARTYGYSPFAYPPGVMTPDVEPVAPAVIENPHVPPKPAKAKSVSDRVTSRALIIDNPYVPASDRAQPAQLSQSGF